MALHLIPFNPSWVSTTGPSGAPLLDIKAIYRRPQKDRFGDLILDEAGFPQWDLTTGLPLQHHAKWIARRFEYVTLATRLDLLAVAAPDVMEHGVVPLHDWQSYVQNRLTDGPWHPAQYVADLKAERAAQVKRLMDTIARFGPDVAEEMEQRAWAEYRLPASFRVAADPEPESKVAPRGGKAKAVAVSA